jgi:hypothetical protein
MFFAGMRFETGAPARGRRTRHSEFSPTALIFHVVVKALRLSDEIAAVDVAATQRAGTDALSRSGETLLVAAGKRPAERRGPSPLLREKGPTPWGAANHPEGCQAAHCLRQRQRNAQRSPLLLAAVTECRLGVDHGRTLSRLLDAFPPALPA